MRKLTHEEFLKRVAFNTKVEVVGIFERMSGTIACRCTVCNEIYNPNCQAILKGCGHKCCSSHTPLTKKSHEQFKKEVKDIYPNIDLMGSYINMHTSIKCSCNHCGYGLKEEWLVRPQSLIQRKNKSDVYCPACNRVRCIKGYTDLATTHPEIAELLADQSLIDKITCSHKEKVTLKCNRCGLEADERLYDIARYGFKCDYCDSGISLGERLMRECLKKLNIHFETQYSPDWAGRKRYDFFIPDYHGLKNIIIETNGHQHYHYYNNWGKSFDDIQINDQYKENLAKTNNIEHYVTIDTSIINKDILINKLNKSLLGEFEDFSMLDWENIFENINDDLKNEAIILYKQGHSFHEIANILNCLPDTVRKWLLRATDFGICDYKKSNNRMKPVINLDTLEVFECATYAERHYSKNPKTKGGSISKICRGIEGKTAFGHRWMYLEDYEKLKPPTSRETKKESQTDSFL